MAECGASWKDASNRSLANHKDLYMLLSHGSELTGAIEPPIYAYRRQMDGAELGSL